MVHPLPIHLSFMNACMYTSIIHLFMVHPLPIHLSFVHACMYTSIIYPCSCPSPATSQSIHCSLHTHGCISLSSTHQPFISTCHCEHCKLCFLDIPLRGLQPRTGDTGKCDEKPGEMAPGEGFAMNTLTWVGIPRTHINLFGMIHIIIQCYCGEGEGRDRRCSGSLQVN